MKKILIWIFMLSSQLVVAEKQECVLHGKIHKSISFEKLYLTIEGKVIDSATIDGNSFDFKILFEPGSICKIETLEKLGNHAKMVRTQAVCYLAAGTISVEIYELSDENPEFSYKLLGPLLTQDYEEKLRVPVLKYNGIIRDLKSK